MDKDNKHFLEIIKRLDILIAVTVDDAAKGGISMADKISKLNDLGVCSADIARILCRPANYVTATLSQRKTRKIKRKSNNE